MEGLIKGNQILKYIWEVIKLITPTVIAFVTIGVNYHLTKKKTQNDDKNKELKEIQLMVSKLDADILNAGEKFLNAIQKCGEKDSNELFAQYETSVNTLMINARTILAYTNIRAEIYKNNKMVFTDTCEEISSFVYKLHDILDWYNVTASHTNIEEYDSLCDDVQKQLINITKEVEEHIIKYCVQL